jgi:NAD(P)-dependent dehydrogenase (short-subunit alcohol dehydrogenase family)
MRNLFDMTGRTVLITGGSRGLGRGLAQGFAEAGANVAVVSRKLDNCQAVARELEQLGVRAFPYACHVGRWDEIEPMFEAVWNHFGRVDVVVNNAGMSPTYPSLGDVTERLFDSVIAVNFKGPFRLCAVAGQRMYEAGGGAIINMSSLASLNGSPGTAFYGGAKAGLNVVSQAFAAAFHPRVRVNTIIVGPFATDVSRHWPDPPDPNNPRRTIGGLRVGLPEDMVSTALYLAADASHYVTGAAIKVDGGGWGVGRLRESADDAVS